jgi:hypothetical protein
MAKKQAGTALTALGAVLFAVAGLVVWLSLPGKRQVAEAEKPTRAELLRQRLAQAEPGRPVTLLGEGGLPGTPPLVVGEAPARYLDPGKRLWLNTPSVRLMELLPPDPDRGDYRLTVELAHVDGEAVSRAGLYAGHSTRESGELTTHAFFQAAFCDPQFMPDGGQDGQDPLLTPGLVVLQTERNGHVKTNWQSVAGTAGPLPGRPRERGVIDRTFALEMRAGEVPRVVIPGRAAETAEHLYLVKDLLRMARLHLPEARERGLDLTPAGGAGIAVWCGAVSIVSVSYEPLPPRQR